MKRKSALEEAKFHIAGLISMLSGKANNAVISPMANNYQIPVQQVNTDYANLISEAYKKLGGATPELMAQIPVMAKQIEKNPYLYPVYPAIPYAETSLGKNVSFPGNYFNWGARIKPYPLQNYTPNYITERVAYRLSTNPAYESFRASPSAEMLQKAGYAPVDDNNPHWLNNMNKALKAFPVRK